MSNTTTAAARKTATGIKVYIHTNCTCSRINGKVIKGLDTVAAAEAYAAEQGLAHTLCKTSVVDEPVAADTTEQGAPEFELVVDNTDQYGKQRRDAVAALAEKLGAELAFTGIKNKHRTGNAAFAVQITKAPAVLQGAVEALLAEIDAELDEVVEDAKSEGTAAGWDSNTKQKHYKNTARAFIVRKGAEAAARLA